ncbi:hypothetical protein L1987_11503 [Smallanthus sonchifolius]|uniref:Uncharacterized protein n=1 Tax=Smallanthus sonchifolius TaxID=185202 RepID=A0ACB9JD76_9ASTR|nr:hypothetical protein L1987_11503 [Smallanthus sonchifolius]
MIPPRRGQIKERIFHEFGEKIRNMTLGGRGNVRENQVSSSSQELDRVLCLCCYMHRDKAFLDDDDDDDDDDVFVMTKNLKIQDHIAKQVVGVLEEHIVHSQSLDIKMEGKGKNEEKNKKTMIPPKRGQVKVKIAQELGETILGTICNKLGGGGNEREKRYDRDQDETFDDDDDEDMYLL